MIEQVNNRKVTMDETATQLEETEKPQILGGENALETDMTDAELEAFVDKTLGIEPKAEVKDDKKVDDKVETPKPADDEKDPPKPHDKKVEAKPDEKLIEAEEQPEEAKPVEIPAVDLSDLFVEIEAFIVDDKGENPQEQTIRLNVGESIPENARFKNDKQLLDLLEAQAEMKSIRDERTSENEAKEQEQEKVTTAEANRQSTIAGWDAEIADLIEDGSIPAPKIKPDEEGFLSDPSTVLVDNVFKFMKTENDKRRADGKRPIQSFESAFNRYNKQADVKAKADADAKEAELTKTRGSMVGGGSSASAGGTKQKIYKAGSARNIYDVDTSDL